MRRREVCRRLHREACHGPSLKAGDGTNPRAAQSLLAIVSPADSARLLARSAMLCVVVLWLRSRDSRCLFILSRDLVDFSSSYEANELVVVRKCKMSNWIKLSLGHSFAVYRPVELRLKAISGFCSFCLRRPRVVVVSCDPTCS